jgi:hypothetical protein
MIVRYSRIGGRVPPQDNEGLQIEDDGGFSMWRSIAPAIGRFAGTLPTSELSSIRREADGAIAAGDFMKPPVPDGAVDVIDTEGAHASLGSNDYADGAWAPLITHLRRLLDELISMPRAAVGIQVSDDGQSARLVHLGDTPLDVDLSQLTVRALLWGRGYRKLGDWTAPEGRPAHGPRVSASDSWSLALPFEHGFRQTRDRVIHAYATFAVTEKDQRADVTAKYTPPVPE